MLSLQRLNAIDGDPNHSARRRAALAAGRGFHPARHIYHLWACRGPLQVKYECSLWAQACSVPPVNRCVPTVSPQSRRLPLHRCCAMHPLKRNVNRNTAQISLSVNAIDVKIAGGFESSVCQTSRGTPWGSTCCRPCTNCWSPYDDQNSRGLHLRLIAYCSC